MTTKTTADRVAAAKATDPGRRHLGTGDAERLAYDHYVATCICGRTFDGHTAGRAHAGLSRHVVAHIRRGTE